MKNGSGTYKNMHKSIATMSEDEIILALGAELNREDRTPRTDMLCRLTGRLNRIAGERIKLEILSAAKKRGKKDVIALLGRCR